MTISRLIGTTTAAVLGFGLAGRHPRNHRTRPACQERLPAAQAPAEDHAGSSGSASKTYAGSPGSGEDHAGSSGSGEDLCRLLRPRLKTMPAPQASREDRCPAPQAPAAPARPPGRSGPCEDHAGCSGSRAAPGQDLSRRLSTRRSGEDHPAVSSQTPERLQGDSERDGCSANSGEDDRTRSPDRSLQRPLQRPLPAAPLRPRKRLPHPRFPVPGVKKT